MTRSAPRLQRLRLPERARIRESVWALSTLAMVSLVFWLRPTLDLDISAMFYGGEGRFAGNRLWLVRTIYDLVPWLGRAAALFGLLVAWRLWRGPGWMGVRWWRRSMLLALGMALIVGAMVNGLLKEGWGRARPVAVAEFGGTAHFTPSWVPVNQCSRNCSFVSGHAATGFLVLMVGALGSPATRRRWLRIGLICGLVVGLGRIAQGGHFASDVLIAGALVWASSCALRWAWLLRMARRQRRSARPLAPRLTAMAN